MNLPSVWVTFDKTANDRPHAVHRTLGKAQDVRAIVVETATRCGWTSEDFPIYEFVPKAKLAAAEAEIAGLRAECERLRGIITKAAADLYASQGLVNYGPLRQTVGGVTRELTEALTTEPSHE